MDIKITPNNYTPEELEDIVFSMGEYVEVMRAMDPIAREYFVAKLEEFVIVYFATERIDKLTLKRQSVLMAHRLFIELHQFEAVDDSLRMYVDRVIGSYFTESSYHEVGVFLALDDTFSDEFFMLLCDLFTQAYFAVVTPYVRITDADAMRESGSVTTLMSRSFVSVEGDIIEALQRNRHVIYIEKDQSVSYMHKILDIIDTIKTGYQCVYRNKPLPFPHALWIHGAKKEMI